jgi:[acyl-carrier-protein] S-malonyltransferase
VEAITDNSNVTKRAYVFPGQGSQAVAMGSSLYATSLAAREVFEEADDQLGFSLSKLIFEGPAEELQDTVNSQPAIMTVSIACLKAWQEAVGQDQAAPSMAAGHSLGEYTSMVAAGVLSFGDAVQLVRERGRLMHQASMDRPGGMAAIIGLDELAFEQICAETGVELANVNADNQIVISGDKIAVARAMDLASARGARRTIPLHVSGAFHSTWMMNAQAGLVNAVSNLEFQDPKFPIVGNCDCVPLTTGDEVKQELVQGLCRCVQWKKSVEYMLNDGVTQFMEFGPGGVLISLIKRIDRDVEAVALSNPDSIQKQMERVH